ncbi:MAG: DUF1521 domain-containing protein [Actinomycetota bacterium]|nr:DUF1521 domain-containing protein [Actinomycetota bacterium]
MTTTCQTTPQGRQVQTDAWTITWDNTTKTLNLTNTKGLKHTALCGDPHIMTDGCPPMDFPSPTCTFILTDGTIIVADAPAANQPLNDLHIFTDDRQHISLGATTPFSDVFGTLFEQTDDGSFYGVVSRPVGTTNPNPVPKNYTDVS